MSYWTDEKAALADPTALAGGGVAGRIHADPALVDRLAGALVAALGIVLQGAEHDLVEADIELHLARRRGEFFND